MPHVSGTKSKKPAPFLVSGEVGTGFSDMAAKDRIFRKDDGKPVQRQHRLGPNRQFNYVYRRGKRVSCKDLTLLYVKSQQRRVGFSVSKKVGVAVVRNRTKRRLRECFRQQLPTMKNGLYVLVARPSAAQATYQQLCQQVSRLLAKLDSDRQKPSPRL